MCGFECFHRYEAKGSNQVRFNSGGRKKNLNYNIEIYYKKFI